MPTKIDVLVFLGLMCAILLVMCIIELREILTAVAHIEGVLRRGSP